MNDQNQQDEKRPIEAEPYEAPAIVESARFEMIAQACSYLSGDLGCELAAPGPTGGG